MKLEDLKVLRCSPDLLDNVKIGQGQLQLIMEQILFLPYTFWSSDLNNLMNNPSNSPVISEKKNTCRYVAVQMSGLGLKVTGQLDIWYLINHCLNRFNYYEFGSVIENEHFKIFSIKMHNHI